MSYVEFNRSAVKPVECVKQGWALIRDKYWLFLGITFVGGLIGGLAPFGILLGPMLCGIYLCLLHKMRGEEVKFETLFKGFDYFGQSIIPAIVQTVPVILLWLILYVPLIVMEMMPLLYPDEIVRGQRPAFSPSMFGYKFAVIGFITLISTAIHVVFIFCYPLIAERNMKGTEAIKTSISATLGNIGGLIGLMLLQVLLSLGGLLACYFGLFFVIPIYYAADVIAYRQVFPSKETFSEEPPMPPKEWE